MSVIKEPMDLTTLRQRLEEGSIDSAEVGAGRGLAQWAAVPKGA